MTGLLICACWSRPHPLSRIDREQEPITQRGGREISDTRSWEPIRNLAKERLLAGKIVLCLATRLARTPDIAFIADAAGFHAFYIDMEHCSISLDDAAKICAAALPIGITPLIRIPDAGLGAAARLLDAGALGIICPNIRGEQDAADFVAACKFAPLGNRSVAGTGPLFGYRSLPLADINRAGNEAVLCIAMLESQEGIDNAEAIAAMPGIDVVMIGCSDLSTKLGFPGEARHPVLVEAFGKLGAACGKHGKALGVGGVRNDHWLVLDLYRLGARFVIIGSDVGYLSSAARADCKALSQSLAAIAEYGDGA